METFNESTATIIKSHKRAAEEHQYAAKAHLEAVKYHMNGDEHQADNSAKLAKEHSEKAIRFDKEVAAYHGLD
jgi:hypothetical protein